MIVDVQRAQRELEDAFVAAEKSHTERWAECDNEQRLVAALNRFSIEHAERMMRRWTELDHLLLMKYIDGNIKTVENSRIKTTPTGVVTGIKQPPYPEWFYRQIVNDHGDVIRER
jgi:hypothetical protein